MVVPPLLLVSHEIITNSIITKTFGIMRKYMIMRNRGVFLGNQVSREINFRKYCSSGFMPYGVHNSKIIIHNNLFIIQNLSITT